MGKNAVDFAPENEGLPFFAYGLFMPGELAFFQIDPYVSSAVRADVHAKVRARDGVPVLDVQEASDTSSGWRITFSDEGAAYAAISAMEPKSQYRWVVHEGMNTLAGVKPRKGADPGFRHDLWRSLGDPTFREALSTAEELLETAPDSWEGFFRVQAGCLLVWSSVERYASLRYGLGRNDKDKVMERLHKIVDEDSFAAAVAATPVEVLPLLRRIYRSDDPTQKADFDPNDPKKSFDYLYQVRSNAAHRGKEPRPDSVLLRASTGELLRIIRATIAGAEREAGDHASRWESGSP